MQGVGAPHPSAAVPSAGSSKDRSWIGILLGILFLLLFIIVVLLLLFYWRYVIQRYNHISLFSYERSLIAGFKTFLRNFTNTEAITVILGIHNMSTDI